MDRGWLALLAALLIVSLAWAQQCQTIEPGENNVLTFVYGRDGIHYGNDLMSVEKAESVPVERNTVVHVDPTTGQYFVQEIPNTAMDLDKTDLFIENKTVKGGPFVFTGIIDDTLRVAQDLPYGHGYGKLLRERYSGRIERATPFAGMVESVRDELQLFFTGVTQGFLRLSESPKIKNVLRSDDFAVYATCESQFCIKEMYSLLSRFANVGASTQMFMEMGASGVMYYIGPKVGITKKLRRKWQRFKFKVAKKLDKVPILKDLRKVFGFYTPEEVLNFLNELPDEARAAALLAVADPTFSTKLTIMTGEGPTHLHELLATMSMADKQKFMATVALLDQRVDDALKVLQKTDVEKLVKETKEASVFKEALDNLKSTLETLKTKTKGSEKILRGEETAVSSIDEMISLIEGLSAPVVKKDGKQIVERGALAEELIEMLQKMRTNTKALYELLAEELPLSKGLYGTARAWAEGIAKKGAPGKATSLFAEWLAPMFYYGLRGGFTNFEAPPGLGAHVGGQFIWLGTVAGPFEIPPEWSTVAFYPAQGYEDAFVDILVGHGVDPGDVFKSIIASTPIGLLATLMENKSGSAGFLGKFVLTPKKERVYEMRSAVIGVSIASPGCPTCELHFGERGALSFVADAPASMFLTENSGKKDGSLAILFGHHTDIELGQDGEIKLGKAKERGETCRQKCPMMGFANNPLAGAFIIASLESAMYVVLPFPMALMMDMLYVSPTYVQPCYECIDDWGGYYVHLFAPYVSEEEAEAILPEGQLSNVVDNILKTLSLDENSVLAKQMEKFKDYLRADEAKKDMVMVQASFEKLASGEFKLRYLISFWTQADELVSATLSGEGSVRVRTEGGDVVVDTEKGKVYVETEDGKKDLGLPPESVRLYVINREIPALIFPSRILKHEPHGTLLTARSAKDYNIRDVNLVSCLEEVFGCEGYTCLGDLVEIHTEKGVVRADEEGLTLMGEDTYKLDDVNVYEQDRHLFVKGDALKYEVKETEGGYKLPMPGKEGIELGAFESAVFQNGIMVWDSSKGVLLVWVERLVTVPKEAVGGVSLGWDDEKGGMTVQLTPSPTASEDEKKLIEQLNEELNKIGQIKVIDAQKGAVFLGKDENGDLVMRVYDKEKNVERKDLIKDYNKLLDYMRQVATAPTILKRIETNAFILEFYTDENGQLRMRIQDFVNNRKVDERVNGVEYFGMGLRIQTESGTYTLSFVQLSNGSIWATLTYPDGKSVEGVLLSIVGAAVKEYKVEKVEQDPNNPGRLIVTDKSGQKHTIEVKLSPDGTPTLSVDGKDMGIINTFQGTKGALWFNPLTGEWSLINGTLLPLAEAFKNGIKISLASDGFAHGQPASVNVYAASPGQTQGISLPLFEGVEKLLLLAALVFLFALLIK